MSYEDALAAAELWRDAGGFREVELGALEPLLWKDGSRTPPDLVRGLTNLGFRVTMTTNASLLQNYAIELKQAGLSLLRISWHTTDAPTYRGISGHGEYERFQRGIHAAAKIGLNISFNRVLLRNIVSDIPKQLDFIEEHGLRLKIYDLMWTPEIADYYNTFYQDWRPIINEFVLPRTLRIERKHFALKRRRIRFHLRGGAFVEIKLGDSIDRSRHPCVSCAHNSKCLEAFGDYLRVEPELYCHFCYLRRDIGFDMRSCLQSKTDRVTILQKQLGTILGNSLKSFLAATPLRFIVVPYCNYNCFFPGTTISWCHKTTGNYSFPGRPTGQLKNPVV